MPLVENILQINKVENLDSWWILFAWYFAPKNPIVQCLKVCLSGSYKILLPCFFLLSDCSIIWICALWSRKIVRRAPFSMPKKSMYSPWLFQKSKSVALRYSEHKINSTFDKINAYLMIADDLRSFFRLLVDFNEWVLFNESWFLASSNDKLDLLDGDLGGVLKSW